MNCRNFDDLVAEWVAGRLPEDQSERMTAHCRICPKCARGEADERKLRGLWASLPEPHSRRDLWPRIAAAIESPAPVRSRLFGAPRLAYACVLAAGACAAILVSRTTVNPGPDNGPVVRMDEQRVVRFAAALQEVPDMDNEYALSFRKSQKMALIGGGR